MKRTLWLAGCLLSLAGCGLSAKIDSRPAYQTSVDEYNACANANPNNLQACEGKRLAMEAAVREFNDKSSGDVKPDTNTTGNEYY